jgi:ribose transport system ATP-binding protein
MQETCVGAPEDTNTVRAPILEMRGMRKSFFGIEALHGVDLDLCPGECLALCGENGAGKSTLIKILGGAFAADAGEIRLGGRKVDVPTPLAAQRLGVSIIYQEFNLVPQLTARENIFLGREETARGFLRHRAERVRTQALFDRIGIRIDPDRRCGDLTVAEQQIVEIAKALSVNVRVIVMDEPSASLASEEVRHLFAMVRELKARGLGVIYISHRLEEVFEIADRVMVLRDGAHVGTCPVHAITRERLIELMVGRSLNTEFPKQAAPLGAERLRVEHLCRGKRVRDVSFAVRAGEILGFAGLVGAGRTETMRLIFGADQPDGGRVFVNGSAVNIHDPRDAIRRRICLLTEDRKGQGLILMHSVRENFGLPNLDLFCRGQFLDQGQERRACAECVSSLRIKIASQEQRVMNLSGGNQQKVVLAKWLARQADIIIFDEPTRGIDVGAKYELYLLMNRLAAEGKAIVMVSSELPEILGMSDRIIVMHAGRITGEIANVAKATQEDVLAMAIA